MIIEFAHHLTWEVISTVLNLPGFRNNLVNIALTLCSIPPPPPPSLGNDWMKTARVRGDCRTVSVQGQCTWHTQTSQWGQSQNVCVSNTYTPIQTWSYLGGVGCLIRSLLFSQRCPRSWPDWLNYLVSEQITIYAWGTLASPLVQAQRLRSELLPRSLNCFVWCLLWHFQDDKLTLLKISNIQGFAPCPYLHARIGNNSERAVSSWSSILATRFFSYFEIAQWLRRYDKIMV